MGSVSDTRSPVAYPEPLQDLLDTFATFDDPSERAQVLISFADAFKPVPPEVATRPSERTTSCPPASRKPTSGRGCSRTGR